MIDKAHRQKKGTRTFFQNKRKASFEEEMPEKRSAHKRSKQVLFGLLCFLVVTGVAAGLGAWTSRYPDEMNMGTACDMSSMSNMDNMQQMDMSSCQNSSGSSPSIPIASLKAPQTSAHIAEFTLTAQYAHLPFLSKGQSDAWTFNGTSPGPTLRVRQGDLVVVHLVNHLSAGVTIHWHGVAVPNIADGVAGVTQDAVKPGQSYTYRFLANDPGTYWYHSHQESFEETGAGLYGMFIITPIRSVVHDDVDISIALHTWNNILAFNMVTEQLAIDARAGQWVRLRFVNTDNGAHRFTLVGAPFVVAALDGHDLNAPTQLTAAPVSIDAGQRYDLRFQMPTQGQVALFAANDNGQYQTTARVLLGRSSSSQSHLAPPQVDQRPFDFTAYGRPTDDRIMPASHFDVTYTISLGFTVGFSNMRPGPVFTLDGQSFPHTPTLVVKPGELVRLRFVNDASSGDHPMHLHGHTFTVLTKNGRPLTGSPVHLDTISVGPHESYDVAFYADNPGLWMIHCHNLFHANHGMDMMLVYPNISTPYTVGYRSGNFPD